MESLADIEEFHIRGMVYIFDVSGLTAAHLKIVPIDKIRKVLKNCEKVVTGRHKSFHIVNVPSALNYIIHFAIKHAQEKIRERVKFYTSFDQLDIVDMKILPMVRSTRVVKVSLHNRFVSQLSIGVRWNNSDEGNVK